MNLSYICIVAALVALVTAAPGIFGSGDNLVSNIFDDSACIVSSVIGGGNPRCNGKTPSD